MVAAGAPAWLAGRRNSLRARLARAPHPPQGAGARRSRIVVGSLAVPCARTATTARHDGAPAAPAPDPRRHGSREIHQRLRRGQQTDGTVAERDRLRDQAQAVFATPGIIVRVSEPTGIVT